MISKKEDPSKLAESFTMLHELMSSAMAPSECHGSNCWWGNGIFTPSSNREGEVDSIPLKQREEQRQAFSKEEVAGNMLHNKWNNGIFTPSFNREGEVASIPLPQREEQRQAF